MSPPVGRDSDSTRERVVAAAVAEFSRHGIAGARVDRIARAAKTSKERVYAHFGSKEALYAHITAQELTAVAEAARMDPADLPGYAGRLHDHFTAHPDRFRLMSWGQLEPPDGQTQTDDADDAHDPIRRSFEGRVELLRQAQRAGLLEPGWDPLDILILVERIATAWAAQPEPARNDDIRNDDSGDEQQREAFLAARRAAVVAAVQRLFPASAGGSADPVTR